MQTELDRSSAPGAERQAAATSYLTRTGNADLLVILGLAADPEAVTRIAKGIGTRKYNNCKRCRRRLWQVWDGVCKRPDCEQVGGAR